MPAGIPAIPTTATLQRTSYAVRLPAPIRPTASQLAPVRVSPPPALRPPRPAVPHFFARARLARHRTALPVLCDGDRITCPRGTAWQRHHGTWIIPGQPSGITLTDRDVRTFWITRHRPGSQFTCIHRIHAADLDLINAPNYTDEDGQILPGLHLRRLIANTLGARTISHYLSLTTGTVIWRSSRVLGDAAFTPLLRR